MTTKDINNWIMYHHIHHLDRLGFAASRIARYMVLDPRTVKKLLAMTDHDYERSLIKAEQRPKALAAYEAFVHDKLKMYQDTSAAQIHDWLRESYTDLPDVSPRSVYNFVMFVRQKYNIPVVHLSREYFPIEELPYGEQAQVDFGIYNMRQSSGNRKKVWFFAMVLSRSRMKFVYFWDIPYTAQSVCLAHEAAFAFFEGIPKTVVYDQDRTILVEENLGDLMLTAAFKQYAGARKYHLHFCRKADPESKGKVENVIQYVKKNFLYNRVYADIRSLNAETLAWLNRTANSLVHNYTKKTPRNEFMIEKLLLTPYTPILIDPKEDKIYHVRKTNTISYKSNFYSLPMGTYQGPGTKVNLKETNGIIEIRSLNEDLICTHQMSLLSGQTITNSNHKRDNTKSLEELIQSISARFTALDRATQYLQRIKADYPRYARDQWQSIDKALSQANNQHDIDSSLDFCIDNNLFNGSDFKEVLMVISTTSKTEIKRNTLTLLDKTNLDKANQAPDKSDIDDYENIINPINTTK